MPCNSEYMEATYREIKSRHIAKNIIFILTKLNRPIDNYISKAAVEYYGNDRKLEVMERFLYKVIKNLSEKELNEFVYNGRCKESRYIANWYDEYKLEIQKEKDEKYKSKKEKQKVDSVLQRLRREEVEILKNYFRK